MSLRRGEKLFLLAHSSTHLTSSGEHSESRWEKRKEDLNESEVQFQRAFHVFGTSEIKVALHTQFKLNLFKYNKAIKYAILTTANSSLYFRLYLQNIQTFLSIHIQYIVTKFLCDLRGHLIYFPHCAEQLSNPYSNQDDYILYCPNLDTENKRGCYS